MADLLITAPSVIPGTGATIIQGTAGETLTAGMVVYLKASDSRYWKAQMDGTAAESGYGVTFGIALNGASAGQPVSVQTLGPITIGAAVAIGTLYVISAAAGSICPIADMASTNYMSILGPASTAAILQLKPWATGIAKA